MSWSLASQAAAYATHTASSTTWNPFALSAAIGQTIARRVTSG